MKLLDGSRDGLGASDGARRTVLNFVAITMLLGLVAAAAPEPASSDRQVYESLGRHVVLPDCADGHCFRPLVAGVLEHVPGPSPVKWKVYAVLVNALAAIAVGRLCLVLGLSTRAGVLASWLYALGSGSLYSVYDTYTSDALMYLVGPIMVIQLLQGRRGRATLMASVAVLAKEFAAAPL